MDLLCQPNVIITSRPNAALPASVKGIDLELETIGFYPDQVKAYLEADPRTKESAVEIQTFLNTHWLMQGLMRIPIQLDALCYTWEDFSGGDVPDTMTRIYNAIEAKLWKKDVVRLGKMNEGEAKQALPNEIVHKTQPETEFLERLAFNGLCNDVINFTSEHRDRLVGKFSLSSTVNDVMSILSFPRSSESSRHEDRSYHFFHLTFQEYFAARYIAQHWIDNKPLEYLFGSEQELPSDPIKFFQQNKYSPRYDVFWRFVAGFLSTKFNKIADFFHEIEKAPLDLLGPIHQRLIMHCLVEVPRESELSCRKELERGLAKWLLFEYEINQSVSLAKEIEFPLQALHDAFCEGSDAMKLMAISRLCGREEIPASFLERGFLWLESDDYDFRKSAVHLLSLRPALSEGVIERMAAKLKNDEPDIPSTVVDVLINRKNLPEQILEKIVSSVEDNRGMNQKTAFKILANQRAFSAEISKSIRLWQKSEDRMIRMGALVISISQDEVSPEVLENMASLMEDEDEALRAATLECLGALRFFPDIVLEGIAARLEDESLSVRLAALKALHGQKKLPEEILNTITNGLDNEDIEIRHQTLGAFLGRSDLSIEVLRGLCSRIENDDSDTNKYFASWTLADQLTDEITLRLARGLENGELVVRKIIMNTLRACQLLPEKAIESIAARMKDPDRGIRGSALLCLTCQQTLPDYLLEDMTMELYEENENFREAAIQYVGKKPRKSLSAEVLNCAYAMLKEKESYQRRCAVQCLGMQKFLPKPYLYGIVARLQDDDQDVRETAIDALDDRVLSEDILNQIVTFLDSENLKTQLTVEAVLRKRKGLYQDLLNSRHAETLYQALLRSSFTEHVTWTINDGVSCVTLGEDVRKVFISNPNDYLNGILKARQASYPSMGSGPQNAILS
ncbi:nacht nucleoside triphosphatase [Penicillium malachiteum]|uniref:Nacht nucleoside triphosphatase n=1 Tax=Penicillium malachiteum TaxID=1324776 RepID=A0AAD6HNI0_9EURO|nr:nacht nucleoside triphosphatase [Penicillium malachiteum]